MLCGHLTLASLEGSPGLNRVKRDREKALEVSGDVEKRKRNRLERKTEHF